MVGHGGTRCLPGSILESLREMQEPLLPKGTLIQTILFVRGGRVVDVRSTSRVHTMNGAFESCVQWRRLTGL
jgi:hypothetical protein